MIFVTTEGVQDQSCKEKFEKKKKTEIDRPKHVNFIQQWPISFIGLSIDIGRLQTNHSATTDKVIIELFLDNVHCKRHTENEWVWNCMDEAGNDQGVTMGPVEAWVTSEQQITIQAHACRGQSILSQS